MITLFCFVFWALVLGSNTEPWNRTTSRVWNSICVMMVLVTFISILMTFIVRVIPTLDQIARAIARHPNWWF